MDGVGLSHDSEALRRRATALHRQYDEAPAQRAALLPEALATLDMALERLRAAEAALAAAERAAQLERQRYRDLVDFSREGYLVTDLRGTILEVNRAATELLGSLQQFLVGKSLATFLAPDEGLAFRFRLLHLAQADRSEEWEVWLHPPNRPAFPALLTVAAIHDVTGEATALRWLVRDVSAHRRAEQALRDAEQRQAASRLEGVTLAARELAQLLEGDLGLIVRALALLRQRLDLPDDLRALAEEAQAGLDRTVQRVAQLQQVVRVETRDTPLGPALDLERSL